MIRFLKRLSIATQFLLLLLFVVASAGLGLYVVANDIRVGQAYQTGSAYADVAEAIGNWSARTNGLWAKSEPSATYEIGNFLERDVVRDATASDLAKVDMSDPASFIPTGEISYHRKNPALIQREISDQLVRSNTPIRFRMVSDDPMNRDNRAARFEYAALEHLRERLAEYQDEPKQMASGASADARHAAMSRSADYYEVTKTKLLYARPVIAAKGCLKCHTTPETAPEAIRVNYPGNGGFGYKEGAIVGVISVEVPLQRDITSFLHQFSDTSWMLIAIFFISLLGVLAFVRIGIIRPVTQLTHYAEAVKKADPDAAVARPSFDDDEKSSANQVHRLSASIKALNSAMRFFRTNGDN